MSDPPANRFRRVAPSGDSGQASEATDRTNFLDALDEIEHAICIALPPGTERIQRRSAEYYTACMALIRLAALFEEDAYEPFLATASTTERRAIVTMRNIAAHAGYREMDDTVLALTLTTKVPDLLSRLRSAATA